MADDNLRMMIDMQEKLQNALGYDIENMSYEERVAYVKEMSIHVNQELNEMLYELPFFKPWKDYSKMTDEEIREAVYKAQKEFIDFWHFMLNIALALGLDSSIIFSEYWEKNIENYRRQTEGYTHDKTYR